MYVILIKKPFFDLCRLITHRDLLCELGLQNLPGDYCVGKCNTVFDLKLTSKIAEDLVKSCLYVALLLMTLYIPVTFFRKVPLELKVGGQLSDYENTQPKSNFIERKGGVWIRVLCPF